LRIRHNAVVNPNPISLIPLFLLLFIRHRSSSRRASGCFRGDSYGCKFDPWYNKHNGYYGDGEVHKRGYHQERYYDLYRYARRFYPEYTAYKLRGRDALVRCSFPGANIIGVSSSYSHDLKT
jgi:hypothetical protein